MVRGLESVNPQAMELMRVLSASKREVFFKLRLYNSLPYLFSALKISASTRSSARSSANGSARLRHRRADHPGDVQFRLGMLYATVIVGSVFSVVFFLRSRSPSAWSCAGRRPAAH
jgi:NitT/TauT family transport system permease protein